jgi:hypothetical protein
VRESREYGALRARASSEDAELGLSAPRGSVRRDACRRTTCARESCDYSQQSRAFGCWFGGACSDPKPSAAGSEGAGTEKGG